MSSKQKRTLSVKDSPTGILRKKARTVESRTPPRPESPNRRALGVHFQPPPNLVSILEAYYSYGQKNIQELEGFFTHMKNQQGPVLLEWLQVLQENVTLLKPDLERFVCEILKISWLSQETAVIASFKHFLVNLSSAHPYYIKHIMGMLVKCFRVANSNDETSASEAEQIHDSIQMMLKLAPLTARNVLLEQCCDCLPYMLTYDEPSHTNCIENLVRLFSYLPNGDDRVFVLKIVIERLVQLDTYVQKDDIDEEDEEDEDNAEGTELQSMIEDGNPSDAEVARRNMDKAMVVMFKFIEVYAQKNSVAKCYPDLLVAFDTFILPTYATGHVQFLMFHLLHLDDSDAHIIRFLDYLWAKFCNPNTPGIIRQSTVAYVASLVARSKKVGMKVMKQVLKSLTNWIHSYIENREDLRSNDYMFTDLQSHGAFYAACQAAFYIFAFRHQEFAESKKDLTFIESLRFTSIVTCSLNPLRVCLPPVVKNFSAIGRHYHIVYCETIIERNNRINLPVIGSLSSGVSSEKTLLLDTFFPFDPYTLKGSKKYIDAFYREYQGTLILEDENEGDDHSDTEWENEFKRTRTDSCNSETFNYGTSPGFIHQ